MRTMPTDLASPVAVPATKRVQFGRALVWLWATWVPLAAADIYVAYDDNGATVFTDRPPYAGAIPLIRAPAVGSASEPSAHGHSDSDVQLPVAGVAVGADVRPTTLTEGERTPPAASGPTQLAHDNKSFRNAD